MLPKASVLGTARCFEPLSHWTTGGSAQTLLKGVLGMRLIRGTVIVLGAFLFASGCKTEVAGISPGGKAGARTDGSANDAPVEVNPGVPITPSTIRDDGKCDPD